MSAGSLPRGGCAEGGDLPDTEERRLMRAMEEKRVPHGAGETRPRLPGNQLEQVGLAALPGKETTTSCPRLLQSD